MPYQLSAKQIEQFSQDVFLVLERFIPPEFAARLADLSGPAVFVVGCELV